MQLMLTKTLRIALSELMAQIKDSSECDTIAIALGNDGRGAIMINGIPVFDLSFAEDEVRTYLREAQQITRAIRHANK